MYSLNSWMQAWLLIYGLQQTVKLSGWAAAGILDALELHVNVVIWLYNGLTLIIIISLD